MVDGPHILVDSHAIGGMHHEIISKENFPIDRDHYLVHLSQKENNHHETIS